jgi:hypothetical protein
MPADGSACAAPFAGVIVTRGTAAALVLVSGPAWAAALAWLVPCPPLVQPAASRASAATAAVPADRLSRLPAAPPPRRVVMVRTALT